MGGYVAGTKTWLIDSIAAANLARALGLQLDEKQLAIIGEHMAAHRQNAVDSTGSRLMSSVLDNIHELIINGQHYRSAEWSDGCRSAEEVVSQVMSRKMLEIAPPEPVSRGEILRNKLVHARRKAETNALITKRR